MRLQIRTPLLPMLVIAAATVGCTTTPDAHALPDGTLSVAGTILSIDTQPWTYDGNAVVMLDTSSRGQISVQLPARWNLCKAAAIDVEALKIGMSVRAVGAAGSDGELVVCSDASHRLAPTK